MPRGTAISCPCPSWSVFECRICTRSPSGSNAKSVMSSATSSDRRNAPAKPSVSNARSRVPRSVSGMSSSIAAMRSAVAGAFCAGLAPLVLRIPPSTTRTAFAAAGDGSPARS